MSRREWLHAMRRELEETHGIARLRWLCGLAWVAALGALPALIAASVLAGVVGGAVGNRGVFLEVYRSGSHSWIGALGLTIPTAAIGTVAAALVLVRHRLAVAVSYAFVTSVALCAAISVTNTAPIGPFMNDWKRVTTDPRALDHAGELRINSAIGAIAVAAALTAVARRRRVQTPERSAPATPRERRSS